MRDVAFVPQRYVLESRLRIRPHDSRQSANLFGSNRIALMRHGRATLLTFGKELLGLTYLGALQVPDFESNLLQTGHDQRQSGNVERVPVSLDHLGRNWREFQT